MTAAEPQPMAGNSEAADDLIAELAKLMAQDAHDAPPPKPAAPSPFTVRIPGEAAAAPRREDTVRVPAAAPTPLQTPVSRTVEPARQQPAAAKTEADPFSFAFDLAPRRQPSNPAAPTPTPTLASFPTPAAAPVAAEPVGTPIQAQPAAQSIEHDSIADLIAAELAMETQPVSAPPRPISEAPDSEAPASSAAALSTPAAAEPQPAPARNADAAWRPVETPLNTGAQERAAPPQQRPVNLQPAARPETSRAEQDAFKIPPVFGLGTAPATQPVQAKAPEPVRISTPSAQVEPNFARPPVAAPAAPASEPAVKPAQVAADDNIGLDPIDEIENLIGRAVRVDLEAPKASAPVQERSALRSLATPLPKQSTPAGRTVSSADEAILAAAQASGAEIGWVEAPEVDEPQPRQRRERRRFAMPGLGFSRAMAGPLVAIVLLLAAGFGLYWVLGMGGGETGPAPLLTADATPVKETPAVQPEPPAEQQSVVFNEIEGVVPGAEEQLVSRDQADVNEVTQVPPTPDVSSEGLANRKVRTVTVRPDGTIVSADNSLAGSTILPVDRPNVPEIPGAQTASPELLNGAPAGNALPDPAAGLAPPAPATPAPSPDAAVPAPFGPADAAAVPPATPGPTAPPVPVVTPGATVPAVDPAGNALPGRTTVIPLQRPSSFAQRPQAAIEAPATLSLPADPAQATAAQLPPPPDAQLATPIPGATEVEALPNNAPAYVQLASQRTEEEARATAQRLVTRYGPLFGGANMEVQRVDLGNRGIFYRVRVPANSAEQASNICVNVKAAGGDCITM